MKKILFFAALTSALMFATLKVQAPDLIVAPSPDFPAGGHEIWVHSELGQSFVATASNAKVGFLVTYDAASAALSAPNAPITQMHVKVYAGEGMSIPALGQTSVTVDTTQNGYVDFDLTTAGITLVPGNVYTLGMSTDNRGWINPSSCVYPANAQPTGSYDLGHPFFAGQITIDETGICDNSFHIVDLAPVVTPTPTPTPTVTATPLPTPTPTVEVVSTGKKVDVKGTISEVGSNYIVVNKVIVRITTTTRINLNYATSLLVGQRVNYKGVKNTDASVTATYIEVK